MSFGALVWVFNCSTFGSNWLGTTDPFLWLLLCLLRSGTITRKGSVLYLFDCKCSRLSQVPWVSLFQLFVSNWVAYHPGSTQTHHQSGNDHNLLVLISTHGINCDFGEPINPSSVLENGNIFYHPWVGSKRSGRIPEVWFNSVELWQFTTIP